MLTKLYLNRSNRQGHTGTTHITTASTLKASGAPSSFTTPAVLMRANMTKNSSSPSPTGITSPFRSSSRSSLMSRIPLAQNRSPKPPS